jgi:acyl-CoA reductase-like NAD-dependent aldehyde dehydrogenase
MLQVLNPATEVVIRELESDTAETLATRLEAARAAQPAWAATPMDTRIACLERFAALIQAERDRLAAIMTAETGKPLAHSRNELDAMDGRVKWFTTHIAETLVERLVLDEGGMQERLRWEPLGVVANISAWNYPWFVGSNVFVPALLAGNAVLYKPSEHATLTGLAIADLLWRSGVPREVFAPLVGGGELGAALVESAVDGIFFTGSYRTGQRIAQAAAGRLVRVQLELGGKDPAYVCDDVDPAAAAAATAEGAFYNAGQSCCAVERVYVHAAIADAFIPAFVQAVQGYRVGDPAREDTWIGPLARGEQLEVLQAQVEDAVRCGATLHCGGTPLPGPGWYYPPTVLSGVTHEMALMREESFGPVIGIMRVEGDAEAVRLMNDTEYGLTAAVYSASQSRAEAILRQVNAGTAYWNCCDRVSPRLPWTGRRHSGIGSTLGEPGIFAFVQPKAWHLRAPG